MKFTGERPVYNTESQKRSIALYETAYKFIKNKRVLDYGCGVGCGISILKKHALSVVGYDPCEEAIKEAQIKYPECIFYSDLSQGFSDIDIITGFEVIEHMEKNDVKELIYKMKDKNIAGYFSTPNGNLFPYQPKTIYERRGFHVWHYTYEELKMLFSVFNNYDIFGLEWDGRYNNQGVFVTYGVYCDH